MNNGPLRRPTPTNLQATGHAKNHPEKPGDPSTPVCHVETLMQGQNVLRLLHRGVEYRLSVTRQGKLILTK